MREELPLALTQHSDTHQCVLPTCTTTTLSDSGRFLRLKTAQAPSMSAWALLLLGLPLCSCTRDAAWRRLADTSSQQHSIARREGDSGEASKADVTTAWLPDPQRHGILCGRTEYSPSWLCDPQRVLTESSADAVDAAIATVAQGRLPYGRTRCGDELVSLQVSPGCSMHMAMQVRLACALARCTAHAPELACTAIRTSHGTCMVLAMQVAVALVQSLNVSQGQSAATAAADLAGALLSTQRRLLNAELRLLMHKQPAHLLPLHLNLRPWRFLPACTCRLAV